jgi:hypothetical protein
MNHFSPLADGPLQGNVADLLKRSLEIEGKWPKRSPPLQHEPAESKDKASAEGVT